MAAKVKADLRLRGLMVGVFSLLLLSSAMAHSGEPDVKAIRRQLVIAVDQRSVADSMAKCLGAIKNKSALVIGFLGTAVALKAKHAWNPYNKLKYLNDAEKDFERAVNTEPHNIEIRFMRFSVEHYVPQFLGYNKHLDVDKIEIITQIDQHEYATADHELVGAIIRFLISSKRCTEAEDRQLEKQLNAFK